MTKNDFSKLSNPANRTAKATKEKPEIRSQHTGFLLTPTTANSLKYIAQFEGTSVNEIANRLFDDYVKKFREDPESANKLDLALELFS